jgi:hypothetical protein
MVIFQRTFFVGASLQHSNSARSLFLLLEFDQTEAGNWLIVPVAEVAVHTRVC